MRIVESAESSLGELSAAKLEGFFSALRVNEADPLILASAVPTSRRPRARAPLPATPLASYFAGLTRWRIWRIPVEILGRFSIRFSDEAEAQRQALGPKLPHQRRHNLTPDEALAGLVLLLLIAAAAFYAGWRFL